MLSEQILENPIAIEKEEKINRKGKKILWKKYIELSKKDKLMLFCRGAFSGKELENFEEKIHKNLRFLNSVCRTLSKSMNRKPESFNSKLAKIPVIGKIYRWYHKINGHTFKFNGPITIIGKRDKLGNCEYPNTRYYRIFKLNKFIR